MSKAPLLLTQHLWYLLILFLMVATKDQQCCLTSKQEILFSMSRLPEHVQLTVLFFLKRVDGPWMKDWRKGRAWCWPKCNVNMYMFIFFKKKLVPLAD